MKQPTKVRLPEVLTNEMLDHFVPCDVELFRKTIIDELTRRVNAMDISEYCTQVLDRMLEDRILRYINKSNYNTLIGNAIGRLVAHSLSISVSKKDKPTDEKEAKP
jgi:hypothetical protein